MTDFGGSGGVMGFPSASPEMSFEPFFKMWSEWLRNSMGSMSSVPGASVPWLTKPGVSTGEETEPLPKGAMASDPLLSALEKAQEANPLRNIIPLDWLEVTRALQTLWMREMSDPARAMQVATDFNRRTFETGGASLAEGARNLLSDIEKGNLSMVDATAFEVGENLAITPGKVVYRNRLMELIQYEPQTQQVYQVPILFIPPWINKYYILDLSEENSFIRYLVEQGFQVFMISWKNPDESMADIEFEDYMTLGVLEAADVARQITGAEKVNPIGYCIGGTLLGVTLAYLAAEEGDEKRGTFNAPTFLTAMLDFSDVGDQSVFIDEPRVEFMELQMLERGYLPGQHLDNMFNLLQPTQLIWTNVITNYLMGQKPPAFDMLYWNSDSTNLPRDAHSWYIRNTYLENNLVEPGKVEFNGRPIDLSKIVGEIYAVGTRNDHIAPWKSGWAMCTLTNGNIRYTLANGGHIAGVVSPPEKGRGYWTSDNCGQFGTADEWFENAEEHEGSWWEDYTGWLEQHSGEQVAPPQVGSEEYPPIEEAPGTYVKEPA